LGKAIEAATAGASATLKMISNRGTRVYPPTGTITDCIDQYRLRFIKADGSLTDADIADLLTRISTVASWAHIEKLQEFDGTQGWTKAQGED
jgi:isocitrate dehydrogenase